MTYVPPFNVIKDRVLIEGSNGTLQVHVEYKTFLGIIRDLLRGVSVDEDWYLGRYPDVVESGMSAQQHFAEHGYFEGRQPSALSINEEWYLATYSDVAEQIAAGDMPDAITHFRVHGYAEGRLPSAF
jgi:hypothetical protein